MQSSSLQNTKQDTKPILKYPGSKWRLAPWIVSFFPPHEHYVEPYAGSAAVFFSKEPSRHEVLNDINGSIVNLFTVMRTRGEELAVAIEMTPWSEEEYELAVNTVPGNDDELEQARRFLVRCWQAHGTKLAKKCTWRHLGTASNASTTALWEKVPERLLVAAKRLKQAEIRNRPAAEIIDAYNSPDCLIYADPPYILESRLSEGHYAHEMTDNDHRELLEALDRHTGAVIVSGYAHPLYDDRLTQWHRVSMPTRAEHGRRRVEVLWLNQKAAGTQQLSLFADAPDAELSGERDESGEVA